MTISLLPQYLTEYVKSGGCGYLSCTVDPDPERRNCICNHRQRIKALFQLDIFPVLLNYQFFALLDEIDFILLLVPAYVLQRILISGCVSIAYFNFGRCNSEGIQEHIGILYIDVLGYFCSVVRYQLCTIKLSPAMYNRVIFGKLVNI